MRDLVVRRCEPEDYKAVHLVYSSPRAMAETLGVPYSSEEAWREELSRERDDNFALVASVHGEIVGHLALSIYMNPRTRHSGHFGIAVRDDWQGRGVGSALMEACLDLADNWLNLTRLDLRVYTDNAPAIALYKKFGFEMEGTHRRFAYRKGEYVDAHVMARLRYGRSAKRTYANRPYHVEPPFHPLRAQPYQGGAMPFTHELLIGEVHAGLGGWHYAVSRRYHPPRSVGGRKEVCDLAREDEYIGGGPRRNR